MPDYTPINDLLVILDGYEMELVGSTAINGEGNDIDIAVRIDVQNLDTVRRRIVDLRRAGCVMSGGAHYEAINLEADDQFTSFKRGDYNLLLCFNNRSWDRFTVGRDYCILLKELGVDMTSKAVRVACHSMATKERLVQVRRDVARIEREIPGDQLQGAVANITIVDEPLLDHRERGDYYD